MQNCLVLLTFAFCTACTAQHERDSENRKPSLQKEQAASLHGPETIVRTIKQDRKGNIWIASWDGVFKYDGTSFANMTEKVSTARFFAVLEDRAGNFWFSTVGSGVYYYDGKSFRQFTTAQGLASDTVTDIYEDSKGHIWFSTAKGASKYDGHSFQNFTEKDGLIDNNLNSIMEDHTGQFWFATSGNTYRYDGKSFSMVTHEGRPFTNVRSMIAGKNGNVWLAGNDGLWLYNKTTFTNFTQKFVGYVYEDSEGNIWTSTNSGMAKKSPNDLSNNNDEGTWMITRYQATSLHNSKVLPDIMKSNETMIFGITEAADGSMWFGTLQGVYRYDGDTFNDFKNHSPR
ncbi:hypothetical protein GCM10017764_09270 [Sphingobacterium griseoflavum]|uniref:Histidine kinase n=2 Tax=Sphingobacterium griseoflavum TaxID=1474952 RepID=A0ABQ3HSZ6_9SPHI|nr:hypothetical protein GCM10017764_09270 [Sphingobacterium griseoflavum]